MHTHIHLRPLPLSRPRMRPWFRKKHCSRFVISAPCDISLMSEEIWSISFLLYGLHDSLRASESENCLNLLIGSPAIPSHGQTSDISKFRQTTSTAQSISIAPSWDGRLNRQQPPWTLRQPRCSTRTSSPVQQRKAP